MERVSERAPLLIGVTGSRFFDRFDAAADRKGAEAFGARMSACMAWLDLHFPHCPKVLLCGAAFGVDLAAAQAALARGPHWSVAALLPFERALFAEDFAPDPDDMESRWAKRPGGEPCACRRDAWMADWETRYAEHRAAFEAVLGAGPGRVVVRELPRLRVAEGGDEVATDAQLSRASPTRDRALRREHYEQVGQWIAESATVLFAHTAEPGGTPSESADGGTARVVACRRTGRPPDRPGLSVAARSGVLRQRWSEVLRSHGRDVWLVDGGPAKAGEPHPPATVLGRRSAFDHRDRWNSFEPGGGEVFEDDEEGRPAPLDTLVVPKLVERLHRRAAEGWWAMLVRRAGGAWGCLLGRHRHAEVAAARNPDPHEAIRALRNALGIAQDRAKKSADLAARLLAVLFTLGVLLFELYADLLAHQRFLLWSYVVLVAASAGLVALARWRQWQPNSEDFRMLSEMLRVQDAWWAAGLPERVDRQQLQGVGRDLAHIPEALTTFVAWIWLDCGWRGEQPLRPAGSAAAAWGRVRGRRAQARGALAAGERDWVGRQWDYFGERIPARELRVRRAAAGSVFLFATAWWLALLVAGLVSTGRFAARLDTAAQTLEQAGVALAAGAMLVAAALAAVPLWWRLQAAALRREAMEDGPLTGVSARRVARALGPPLAAALGLLLAAFAAGPLLRLCDNTTGSIGPHDAFHWIGLVLVAVLIAVAGAWRYVADKSVWEAEALEYRDAHRRFRLAEHALAAALGGRGGPIDVDRAREIVRELGRSALVENEAWLKSRRERPLTTV